MKLKACGKINLFLNVVGKKDDYHLLEMLNSSVSVFDEVEIEKYDGIFCDSPFGEKDVAIKAAKAFIERYKTCGVKIKIKKNIPVGGGLGGSSADAAAVIFGMSKLYKKTLLFKDIASFASVGADVPFMINGGLAKVSGIGEEVKRLPYNLDLSGVIIKGNGSNLAKDVYEAYDNIGRTSSVSIDSIAKAAGNLGAYNEAKTAGMIEESNSDLRRKLMEYDLLEHTYNALSDAARLCDKDIARAEESLNKLNAKAVLVSGSGSSVVGFFGEKKAEEVSKILAEEFPYVSVFRTVPSGVEITEE